jgi:hypothetical protein
MRKTKLATHLSLVFSVMPPVLIALVIGEYGVDLIDWDQWEVAGFFEKAARGSLSLGDLFAQQAEYRQFFPNLIFVGLGRLTHWNIKAEMFVSLALACLVFVNIRHLTWLTAGPDDSRRWLLTVVSSLLIFSPAQFENWLLGEQIIYFMPVACLTTCLRVAYAGVGRATRVITCMLLSTVSTFSSANGMVCWLVVPVVLFFSHDEKGGRTMYPAAWAIGLALNVAAYLYGYHKPPYTPSLSESLHHPAGGASFFLAFLGAPLATSHRLMAVAVSVGALSSLLFIASCMYALKSASDRALTRRVAGWVALGGYSVITGLVVTVARLGYGPDQALNSRYTTFSLYLILSLCHLLPITLDDMRAKGRLARAGRFTHRLPSAVFASIILLHLFNSAAAIRQIAWMKARRLQAKACTLFINAVPDQCLDRGFPDLGVVKARLNAVNDLGYLRPPLIRSNRIADITQEVDTNPHSRGTFEVFERSDDGKLMASGWACSRGCTEPADAVLLAYSVDAGEPIIFAIAQLQIAPPSFSALLGRSLPTDWRWRKELPPAFTPAYPARISAWAFEASTGKAYRLGGSYTVENLSGDLRLQADRGP